MSLRESQRDDLKRLHSAILNDVTDEMGYRENVIPCTRIRALWQRDPVVGTAFPAQYVEIGYREEGSADPRESTGLSFFDDIEPGEFVVQATPADTTAGVWGEILSTIAQESGAVGTLVDGPTRDSRLIEEHGYPVWAAGHSAIESFGRVSLREYDVPVEIQGVTISPGDVVFADYESIVVLEPDIVDEVIERGMAELESENAVRSDVRSGDSVFEVWDRYETL